MQAVFRYPGGKARLAKKIVSLFPPGDTYDVFVDVFGGSAAVLLALPDRPGLLKVYNDVDSELAGFFKVLRDPKMRERLIEILHGRRIPGSSLKSAWKCRYQMTR